MHEPCIYCPESGADVCVRTVATGEGHNRHEFAHRGCAEARGSVPLYALLEPKGGEADR
ncbi:hypothetical protein ACLGI4_20690 [Streptomyces sp. HMX112]|uniref:hypothetical protein n=1 Tax=Streptomyces sp. HMX112 TaxID=3390850 RepID=UPI003A80966C